MELYLSHRCITESILDLQQKLDSTSASPSREPPLFTSAGQPLAEKRTSPLHPNVQTSVSVRSQFTYIQYCLIQDGVSLPTSLLHITTP